MRGRTSSLLSRCLVRMSCCCSLNSSNGSIASCTGSFNRQSLGQQFCPFCCIGASAIWKSKPPGTFAPPVADTAMAAAVPVLHLASPVTPPTRQSVALVASLAGPTVKAAKVPLARPNQHIATDTNIGIVDVKLTEPIRLCRPSRLLQRCLCVVDPSERGPCFKFAQFDGSGGGFWQRFLSFKHVCARSDNSLEHLHVSLEALRCRSRCPRPHGVAGVGEEDHVDRLRRASMKASMKLHALRDFPRVDVIYTQTPNEE